MRRAADAGAWSRSALVAVIGAVAALRLEPDAGTDQLVDNDSAAFAATEDFKQRFGDDAVVVLVKGDLEQLVLTSDLGKLLSLEGCLSGNVEGGEVFTDEPAPAPCARLAESEAGAGGARAARPSSTSRRSRPSEVLSEQTQAAEREARAAAAAAAPGRPPPGARRGEQRAAAEAAAPEVITRFEQQLIAARDRLRPERPAAARRPDVRQLGRLRPSRTPAQPKPRFSIFWPERRGGPDPDPAEART